MIEPSFIYIIHMCLCAYAALMGRNNFSTFCCYCCCWGKWREWSLLMVSVRKTRSYEWATISSSAINCHTKQWHLYKLKLSTLFNAVFLHLALLFAGTLSKHILRLMDASFCLMIQLNIFENKCENGVWWALFALFAWSMWNYENSRKKINFLLCYIE